MRRLALIPLALLLGCFDFDSLSGTYVPPLTDGSTPGDIACDKTPNTLQEDCTQNGDINNNCLVGCDDPTCSDHVACFASRGYKAYGAVVDNTNQCPGQTTNSTIYQSIANPTTCNGSCSCNNATTTCTSTLHVYPTKGDCMGKTNDAPVAISDGANKCPAVVSVKDSYYSVDKLTVGQCTAKNATVPLTPTWGTTKVLCDQSASKLLRFGDMQRNGIMCVVFNGTDTSVCAAAKPYTKASVYYTGATGSSSCACSCAPSGGCTLTNGATNLLNLTDKAACNGAQTLSPIKVDSTCLQALDTNMMTYQAAAASTNLVAPTCNAAGTVSGTFAAAGGITLCCM